MSLLRDLINRNGVESSGRFGFLYSVILSNSIVWYAWLWISIWTRSLVDIPMGVVYAYGIANGVAFAGKGLQSMAERPVADTSTMIETKSIVENKGIEGDRN
jgi:hypothetical protein